jgi:hypothetical protein
VETPLISEGCCKDVHGGRARTPVATFENESDLLSFVTGEKSLLRQETSYREELTLFATYNGTTLTPLF